REGDSQKLRGPRAPGETVCTTLTFEPPDSADLARARPSPSPPATGSLRGRVLLDPGIPARAIELKLHDDSPAARRAALSPLLSADGAFSFSSVPVGPARLEVSTHGFLPAAERRPLFQARVEVAAGESPATDPVEIDLRGKVFAHTIALKGLERGHDFQASAFFAPARQSQRSRVYLRTGQLPVVLVSPWEALDVEIRVPGHRDVSLLDLRERATVELEPGIPVRLRLRTDGALPEPPRYLKATLVAVDDSHQGIDWGGPAFDAKGEILIYAGKPGPAKVVWIAAKHEGSGGIRDTVRAQYVVVRDVPQEQVFDVSLSAAELAEILRQLR
ncbi:MAG TPA: carboxypeptidase-like regulatory domain-containing protein, partial [Planctomycetota bacterium]|nr:carboxypeptidase-like regulatory domain-containing protein [Planctomycetota bacterium]